MVRSRPGEPGVDVAGAARREPADAPASPNVHGDLDELMDHRPEFRVRLQGYDRLEVDNYTAWAEGELVAVRRQVDHLLSRFGECSAELEIARRLLADAPRGREPFPVSERVQQMLRLAADEAAALTEAGEREAERIVAEARAEADAWLRKAHEIKNMAVAAADELADHARRDRATAAQAIERARVEAAELLRAAAAERDRLAELAAQERERAAADAAAHLVAVQTQVDDLVGQGEQARQVLRALGDRVGEALQAVNGTVSEDQVNGPVSGAPSRTHVIRGNVAVEGAARDTGEEPAPAAEPAVPGARDEPGVVAMVGRPAPVPH